MAGKPHATYPFFPDPLYTELILGHALTILLTVLALIAPVQLGDLADPNVTSEHIKPEWYFYAVFRWLNLNSFEVGITGSIVAVGLFMFWQFIDRSLVRAFPVERISIWIGIVVVLTWIAFTVWEAFV